MSQVVSHLEVAGGGGEFGQHCTCSLSVLHTHRCAEESLFVSFSLLVVIVHVVYK